VGCWKAAAAKPILFVLAAFQGIGSGAVEPLYIGFNYANAWAASTQVAATRMALVEPWRMLLQMCFIGLLTKLAPGVASNFAFNVNDEQAEYELLPVVLQVVFGLAATCSLSCGILCLWIPLDSKLRLPRVALDFSLYRSYRYLILSECVSKLGGFLDILYISWMLIAGWQRIDIAGFFYATGGAGALVLLIFCYYVAEIHGPNRTVIALTALTLFPPTLVGGLAIFSSSRLGDGAVACLLSAAIILTSLKRLAASLLKIFSLPSRWKYLTFQAHSALLLQTLEAISPFLLLALSKILALPLEVAGDYAQSDVFARSSLLLSLPFTVVYFIINLLTFYPLVEEGILSWHVRPAEPQADANLIGARTTVLVHHAKDKFRASVSGKEPVGRERSLLSPKKIISNLLSRRGSSHRKHVVYARTLEEIEASTLVEEEIEPQVQPPDPDRRTAADRVTNGGRVSTTV